MEACNLKKGNVVVFNNTPHVTENIDVKTPSARGASTLYKVRFRNLVTGQKRDETFHGGDMLQEADTEKKQMQFLYKDETFATFMALDDYSQFEMEVSSLEYELQFLLDGMENITGLIFEGNLIAIELPSVVDLEVIDTAPGIKGASATARTKPATLSTGLIVQVPEYISNGDTIRVVTETAKFSSRV